MVSCVRILGTTNWDVCTPLMGFRPWIAVTGSIIYGLTTYFPIIIMAGHTSKFCASPSPLDISWILVDHRPQILRGLLYFRLQSALNSEQDTLRYLLFLFVLLFVWLFDVWNGLKIKEQQKWIK